MTNERPKPQSNLVRYLSGLVAVVLPMLIVAVTLYGLEQFRDAADARENRNAGFVMNGRVTDRGVVASIERTLEKYDPEVVILGNSLSNTDILPALVAKRLGLPKTKVQRFSIPNSIGAHWYAILKNRLYANGHQPRLVLILSDLQSALATTPRTEPSYLNLTVHLDQDEPVIDEKLGKRNYIWTRVRENRGKLRDRSLKGMRNFMVDLLYWRDFSADHGKTSAALDRTFDASETDLRLHNNVIPIFALERELVPFDPAMLPGPRKSFLPNITKMVAENSGRVVYLRPPMSPLLPKEAGDIVLPGTEGRVRRLVENRDGNYLDLRALNMSAGHFYNVDHMNPEGARRFTEAVCQLLQQILADANSDTQWNQRQRPVEIELFTAVALDNGTLVHRKIEAEYKTTPTEAPGANRPFVRARAQAAFFQTESMGFVSDLATMGVTPFAARCSPLRVLEDGVELPQTNVPCDEVFKHGNGRMCHTNERLIFTSTDGESPMVNGKSYTLAMDPERECEGAAWMYPEDHFRIKVPDEELLRIVRGGRSLRIDAVDMGGKDEHAELHIRLRVNGQLRVERKVSTEQLETGAAVFRINPTIGAAVRDVTLDLVNNSKNFVLVTSTVISERGEPLPN